MQPKELQETDESEAREQETEKMIRREESSGEKRGGSLEILISMNTHTSTCIDQVWWVSCSLHANKLSDYCIMSLSEAVIHSCISGSFIGRDEVSTSQSLCWFVLRRLPALLPWQHAISLSSSSLVSGFSLCIQSLYNLFLSLSSFLRLESVLSFMYTERESKRNLC